MFRGTEPGVIAHLPHRGCNRHCLVRETADAQGPEAGEGVEPCAIPHSALQIAKVLFAREHRRLRRAHVEIGPAENASLVERH